MIKLKDILVELDATLHSHAENGEDAITNFIYLIYRNVNTAVKKELQAQAREAGTYLEDIPEYLPKFDGKVKSWSKSNTVWSKGRYFVCRLSVDHDNYYFLVDEKQEYLEDAILGVIITKYTEHKYSSVQLGKFYKLTGEEVHWSNVSERGKGYGAMLYDAVLEYAGVLFSDNTLYRGSFNMWMHHMAKSAFFGCVFRPNLGRLMSDAMQYIIPIDVRSVNKNWFDDDLIDRFVAIKDRSLLPKPVRRLEYNTRGLNPATELMFAVIDETFIFKKQYNINGEKTHKGYTVEDYLENFSSISEWVESLDLDLFDARTRGLAEFASFKVSFQDIKSYDRVKLAIVSCNDVVLLLKNAGERISVQILD